MIRAILEEYAGIIAIVIAIALAGSVIGYALYTINSVGITNLKYVKLLPWAYAYYNNDRIVLWITNPGLISFTVTKVIADNGLILLDHPVGPIAPNGYIVLKFPYVKVRKVISARIYKVTLNVTFRGDNDVTDRVTILAESYYGNNNVTKIVKVVKTEGYVHYIQNTSNIITLYFEDCSHCDFDYRDLILAVENIGQRLVLVQEYEKGGYPHQLYINGTLVNYKPPGATQQGKTWIYNLRLIETRYTTRRVILYSPHWITIVACVSGHICKQFTTPIWNVTILTQVINETTNITNKKPSWYVPHVYTPPGYATIYISITPPTTPTWTYIKIQTPTGINKTYLIATKVMVMHVRYVKIGFYTWYVPYASSAGDYALVRAPAAAIRGATFYGTNEADLTTYWIVNVSNGKPVLEIINPSTEIEKDIHLYAYTPIKAIHVDHIILTGTLALTVPIGTKVTIYTPPELYGWRVLNHRVRTYGVEIFIGNSYSEGAYLKVPTNIIGAISECGDQGTCIETPPTALTEYAFLGYLGPLVNGLVKKNRVTFIVNRSGYVLVVYTLNPSTALIHIFAKQLTKPRIEKHIPPIPIGTVYYISPTYIGARRLKFIIDTVHLDKIETIKAQIGSTIIIKVRRTITYTICHSCPPYLCGIGPCWDITIQLTNKTNMVKINVSNITRTYKIVLTYKVVKVKQSNPSLCTPCQQPPKGPTSSPPPPKVVKYVIVNPKAVLNGGCSILEKCVNNMCTIIGEVCGG